MFSFSRWRYRRLIELLNDVTLHIEGHLQDTYRSQIRAITHVMPDMRFRRYTVSGSSASKYECSLSRFPNQSNYTRLASVHFRNHAEVYRAKLYIAYGRLTEVVFIDKAASPRILSGISIDQVFASQDLNTLIAPPQQPVTPLLSIDTILSDTSQFKSWLLKAKVESFHAPIVNLKGYLRFDMVRTVFPNDYLEVLAHCDGIRLGLLTIHGVNCIYAVKMNGFNYHVIAEYETSSGICRVGLLQCAKDGKLFEICLSQNTVVPLSCGLNSFVDQLLSRQ